MKMSNFILCVVIGSGIGCGIQKYRLNKLKKKKENLEAERSILVDELIDSIEALNNVRDEYTTLLIKQFNKTPN